MDLLSTERRFLAVATATLAGFTDGVGFLDLGGYFVSFMSGNTTRFAVNVVTAPADAWAPLGLIAAFVVGVFAGALVAHRAGERRKSSVFALVAVGLAVAAALAGFHLTALSPLFIAAAMGAANNAFQRDGEVAFGVTYMTGALVKLGQRLAGSLVGDTRPWQPHLVLWLGLTGGAICGAALHLQIGSSALWVAAVSAGGLGLVARFALDA